MKYVLAALLVLILGILAWAMWAQKRLGEADMRSEINRARIEALEHAGELVTARYDYDGKHYEFVKGAEETDEQFIQSCDDHVFRGIVRASNFCWTSVCRTPQGVTYTVQLCAPTQAQLDALVAAYCATHDCDECR